ncbi:hypothetical protein [Ruegeria sp. HKCCD7318]|nr:hypothetical protein [Ruegeria sp. HKCCD7318]
MGLVRVTFDGGKNVQVISSKKLFFVVVVTVAVLGCTVISGYSLPSVISWIIVGVVLAFILGKLTDDDPNSDDEAESSDVSVSNVYSDVEKEKARESGSSTAEAASSSDSGDAGGGGGDAGI